MNIFIIYIMNIYNLNILFIIHVKSLSDRVTMLTCDIVVHDHSET